MFNKRLLICVAVIVLIQATLQQAQEAPAVVACSTKSGANAGVLAWLEKQGVKLNQVVTKSAGEVCKGEFDLNGSCCVPDSLKDIVKQKNEKLVQRTMRFVKVLGRISSKLMKSLAKALPKINNKDLQKKIELIKGGTGTLASKFREANRLIPSSDAEMAKFKDFIKNFEDQLKEYRKHGTNCIKAMNRARANLYCALCSGKATDYLKSSGGDNFKVKINKESCDSVVDACFPVWKFNWWVRTAVKYAIVNINNKKGDKAEDKVKSEIELSDVEIDDLKSTFDKCKFNAETKKIECDVTQTATFKLEDHVKRLCSLAIVINKQNGALEGDENVGEFDENEVDKIDQTIDPEPAPVTPVTPVPVEPKPVPVNPTVKAVTERLLQTTTEDPNYGTEVDSTSSSFKLMSSDSTGVVPPANADTTNAGETPSNANILVSLCISFVFSSIAVLF